MATQGVPVTYGPPTGSSINGQSLEESKQRMEKIQQQLVTYKRQLEAIQGHDGIGSAVEDPEEIKRLNKKIEELMAELKHLQRNQLDQETHELKAAANNTSA